jgi:hypothetical protein
MGGPMNIHQHELYPRLVQLSAAASRVQEAQGLLYRFLDAWLPSGYAP